jgi:hypothetical protein
MRLKQSVFYRQTGVRQRNHLMRPRLIPMEKLILPYETVYHFWPVDTATLGPNPQDPLLSNVNGRLFIEHITEMDGREGNPRRTVLNPTMMKNEFRRKTRGFKPLRKEQALTINTRNVLVMNYGMLSSLYRYIPSYKVPYFRWNNVAQTFWNRVEGIQSRFGWNQYIDLHLPDRLPKLEEFKRASRTLNQKTLELFNSQAQFNLLDLWRWMGEDRDESNLTVLSDKTLENVNLLVRLKGYFFVINLGVIDEWRKDPTDDNDSGLEGTQMQRYFLRLLHGLRDFMSGVTEPDVTEDDKPVSDHPADSKEPKTVDVAKTETEKEAPTEPSSTESTKSDDDDALLLPEFDDDITLPDPVSNLETPVFDSRDLPKENRQVDPDAKTVTLPAEETGSVASVDEGPKFSERLTQGIAQRAFDLHEAGLMSAKAYEKSLADAKTYTDLKDPYGSGRPLTEMLTVSEEDLALPEPKPVPNTDTIPDESMLHSKLKGIQRKYIKDVLHKDVVSSVMAIQNQGVAVRDYSVETMQDTMNHYEVHTVTLKPVRGRQSTVRFRLPVVDKDGRFISNGVTNRMRLQRADIPIRKVNPTRVALTSYYNKTFVDRSERSINNYEKWLTKQITSRGVDPENEVITDLKLSNVFVKTEHLPRIYSLLAKRFVRFNAGDYELYFDYKNRVAHFKDNHGVDVEQVENDQQVLVGMYRQQPILVDGYNTFYVQTRDGMEVVGTVHDLLGIESAKAPIEIVEIGVANKTFPIGFVLAYHMGLSKLIEYLGCEVNRLRRGERRSTQSDEYTLIFEDEVLVFSRLDQRATMVLAGLNRYHQTLKQYSVWDFDRKDVFYRVVEDAGLGVRYLREMDTLFQAWVDPITQGLLEQMGEPTEFLPLLMRAVELLQTDFSPEEVDGAYMRYRGYERLAGMVYSELTRSAKLFNARASVGENAVELNPYAVWQKIVQDPSVAIVEDSNPMANLREQEAMTYRGDGGRGAQSMVESTRIYHESDLGVVSESTVDSGDVGVIAYLSPDANLDSLRGTTRRFNKDTDGASKLMSSSTLLAPAADHDDPKRQNFIAIQQQQGVFADGYEPTPLRTGYEQVIAHRTSDIFATTAEDEGKVVSVSKQSIVVEYKDGEKVHVELGKRHGTAAGVTYPHEVVTDLKEGDKVKYGDVLAYNRKFFTPDHLNPGQVVWKGGALCRTALIDNIDTLEDGSAISQEAAKKLTTQTTETRTIEVRFDQYMHDLVKEGDHVGIDSILCTIEDPETAENQLFDDAALDTLRRLSAMTPRAKVTGTISRIEVFYHGDFEDLSENLQTLAIAGDRKRKRQAKALGTPAFTGQVDASFRVKGKALDPDTLAIRIYIDHDVAASVGDKGVFGNQMKTVFSRVMTGTNTTESGEPIDAIFGNTSIEDRMVLSPKLMGTTNALLITLSKHIAAVYRGTTDVRNKEKS